MLKCKINPEFDIYNVERTFDKMWITSLIYPKI
jgi:hypothetical protein